jgi:hypothetical protein
MAQQLLQFGATTPEMVMQVANSGNLGPAVDAGRELQYFLDSENECLLDGAEVLVMATDEHEAHVRTHTRLLSTPWMRKPHLAEKLGIQNAPQIQAAIMAHIQQHMQYLAGNAADATAATAGQQPGQPQSMPSAALGHPPAQPGPAGQTAQAAQQNSGVQMPSQPAPAQMPG